MSRLIRIFIPTAWKRYSVLATWTNGSRSSPMSVTALRRLPEVGGKNDSSRQRVFRVFSLQIRPVLGLLKALEILGNRSELFERRLEVGDDVRRNNLGRWQVRGFFERIIL